MALKLPSLKSSRETVAGESGSIMGRSLPLIGRLPFERRLTLMASAAGLLLVLAIATGYLERRDAGYDNQYLELSGNLVMLTQRVAKDAGSALVGKQTAIEGLPQARADMELILKTLDKGGPDLPATMGEPRKALDKLLPVAKQSLQYIKDVEDGRAGLLTVSRATDVVQELIPLMRDAFSQMTAAGLDNGRVTRLALLIERIGKDANSMLGGTVSNEQISALGSDTQAADELLAGFDQTNPAVAKVADLFLSYRNSVYAVISQAQGLFGAKRGVNEYFDSVSGTKNGPFLTDSQELVRAYKSAATARPYSLISLVSGALVLLIMVLVFKEYLEDSRRRVKQAEQTNRKNQNAILKLMNELSDLADGDLTIKATVSEDITGAIADSVNYTTEELRKLVARVYGVADKMGEATQNADTITRRLLVSTQKQEREIHDAGDAVQLMTQSIKEVDSSAAQSAQVARRTLTATEQGTRAVRNTITGMDGIREQIQETSKRIKRLGESSQEIGEIVDLISDITEQTNVLALNAAIQAASAGEAGRGFSVVAEEVQRLAERSAEATKQIGSLVKTIQSDTHDAVAAMEKSTLGVVEGAKLSEVAGQSLREIEQVSNELAGLINSISVSTQVQTDMASEVASVMQDILQITEQTTQGTNATASSVVQLTELATELRGSVAGFKL